MRVGQRDRTYNNC